MTSKQAKAQFSNDMEKITDESNSNVNNSDEASNNSPNIKPRKNKSRSEISLTEEIRDSAQFPKLYKKKNDATQDQIITPVDANNNNENLRTQLNDLKQKFSKPGASSKFVVAQEGSKEEVPKSKRPAKVYRELNKQDKDRLAKMMKKHKPLLLSAHPDDAAIIDQLFSQKGREMMQWKKEHGATSLDVNDVYAHWYDNSNHSDKSQSNKANSIITDSSSQSSFTANYPEYPQFRQDKMS